MLVSNLQSSPAGAVGRDVQQAGAICYRRSGNGELSVLLVGSRRNGRWGVPKGHFDPGESSSAAARREAFEEAGVIGTVDTDVLRSFSYRKDSSTHRYHVAVHLLRVYEIAAEFPEKTIRKQKWFPLKVAIRDVAQPGLRVLLSQLEAAPL
jgi:8-oxo-dGTP pyrophosphatase MutT (NUDIX family)